MRPGKRIGLILAVLAGTCAAPCVAFEVSSARVVGVVDGDTLTVVVGGRQVTVRIADIDAPEKCQAHGTRAKQVLSELVMGLTVRLKITGKDAYGRSVANIETDDHADVGEAMIDRGAAWVYRKYSQDARLLKAEASAKRFRVGLWGDATQQPPWEWRAGGGSCEQTKSAQRKPDATLKTPPSQSSKPPVITTDSAAAILDPLVKRSEAEARAAAQATQIYQPSRQFNGPPQIYTGPRGGRYYIDSSGNKQYVEKNK
jgi:endonuclease YncB( thermonuclease family)